MFSVLLHCHCETIVLLYLSHLKQWTSINTSLVHRNKRKKHENEKKGQQTLFHVGVKTKKPESVLEAEVVSALHRKPDKYDDDTVPTVLTTGNYNLYSEIIPYEDSNFNPSLTDFVLLSDSSNIVGQNTNLESEKAFKKQITF